MTLYEIDQSIIGLMNEDGEIADLDAFEALQMERDEKIENIALWIKKFGFRRKKPSGRKKNHLQNGARPQRTS